ncbi:hypothetical protein [Mycoplasma mycoides]|uniref:hypothetical protein n=1 Tax=Mycoplasma mycoides TaxID=2102 RepID=UPI00223FB0C1|nr:hypothetical protein [Mycoplasma mycoides]QVJ96029.1 hypothetical protein I7632_03280 [Mycoplasma mycoides subsp. capri]QVJ96923.1 hypothetical protein I7633_03235 [Mycoplasma mycoides subsp. capri]QVK00786.1 hypothetical protein I7635_03230 [Mycoplasma mycoides subsp. capri]
MKKANILNLIRYHIENNDIGFIKEALMIADDFTINGDIELAEYIVQLIKPISDEYMWLKDEFFNIQNHLIKKEDLSIDRDNQLLFEYFHNKYKNEKIDFNNFLNKPVFIKLWNDSELYKGYLIKINTKPEQYRILPFEYNSTNYNIIFLKSDVEWLQTKYNIRYLTNDFILTSKEKQLYLQNKIKD